ncbi:MAG: hypothetical protein H0X31_04895 [Nostocaceae cyanobacterium]|nr:hypothetical protein [Nostocaceae cyanobacterium]
MATNLRKTVKNNFALVAVLLGYGMTLATIVPAHALSKSDVNHAATVSPTGQKSIIIAQTAPFPVQGTRKDEVVRKGYMETSFDLDSNGNLNARTKTWTDVKLKGFTGGVLIAFTDTSGSVIWSTEQQRYGVDGKLIGNSNRTENWQAKVPPNTLSRIGGYAILQEYTPRSRVFDWIRSPEGQQTIKGVVNIFRKS